jgi:hypothetical protein
MKVYAACLLAGLSLALPSIVTAQSVDTRYCEALSQKYTRFVADPNAGKIHVEIPSDVAAAQAKCDSDPKTAIPVLQKALTDKKIELPPRT